MREQLIKYVDLLFAGAGNTEDIKQEILQNTLDRYDDLIAQGKSPEAAYRLAISGIGDINEILESIPLDTYGGAEEFPPRKKLETEPDAPWKKILRAIAVALYILSPIPLFVLTELGLDTIGLCGTIAIVGIATAMIIIASKGETKKQEEEKIEYSPAEQLRKSISSTIWTGGLVAYFVLSFITGSWHITWLVFPIIRAVQGLVNACMDLKEAS